MLVWNGCVDDDKDNNDDDVNRCKHRIVQRTYEGYGDHDYEGRSDFDDPHNGSDRDACKEVCYCFSCCFVSTLVLNHSRLR